MSRIRGCVRVKCCKCVNESVLSGHVSFYCVLITAF